MGYVFFTLYAIILVCILDTPGAPESIDIAEIGPQFLVMRWKEPSNNGGSPITGYLLEKREVNRRTWQKVSEVIRDDF